MKRFTAVLVVLFSFTVAAQQEPESKDVAVTVYNSNLGVIKDTRVMDIPEGTSEIKLTDVAENINPTTVYIDINGQVIEQNYRYDLVNFGKILSRYIGKKIDLYGEQGNVISGKLLSGFGGQLVLQKDNGGLEMIPSLEDYRVSVGSLPEGLITKPTLVWSVQSDDGGEQDVTVTYHTSGLNWHAEYVAVLNEDDTRVDLNAWVSIDNNSGGTYKNAKLKLVAGEVNRVSQAPAPRRVYDAMVKTEAAEAQFAEKEFFEYHIYNLQRRTTLAENETKQISLFEVENVPVHKKYFYGPKYSYGSGDKRHAAVIVEFKNSSENGMGMPMPKGVVRVNKSDGETMEFVGEDRVDHTPKNEPVKLTLGEAFDVVIEEKQTDNKRISNRVYENEFEIKIKNHKDEDITVDVERRLGGDWEILSSSHEWKKEDAYTIAYKIPVPADGETVLTYRVRYVW